jgi:hypothetical protein
MVVSETIAGLGAFKTAFDMAKALQGIHDTTERDRAVINLQKEILSAQAEQFSLLQQVSALEAKLASFDTWETEKQKYELKALRRTGIAYVLRPEERVGKPPHGICPHCYERKIKSILQSNGQVKWTDHLWICSSCNTKVAASSEAFKEIYEEA